ATRTLRRQPRPAGGRIPARHAELRAPRSTRADAVRRPLAARGQGPQHLGAAGAVARELNRTTAGARTILPRNDSPVLPRAPVRGARVGVRVVEERSENLAVVRGVLQPPRLSFDR